MRTIQSIKKIANTVYVNFSDGRFGSRTLDAGQWTNAGMSDAELAAARKLANRDGKWIEYRTPRTATQRATGRPNLDNEDELNVEYPLLRATIEIDARSE